MVDPGTYTVKLAMGDTNQTASVKIDEDSRIELSDADRAKRHEAIMKAFDATRDMTRDQRQITSLKTAIDQFKAIWSRPGGAAGATGATGSTARRCPKATAAADATHWRRGGGRGAAVVAEELPIPQLLKLLLRAEPLKPSPLPFRKMFAKLPKIFPSRLTKSPANS